MPFSDSFAAGLAIIREALQSRSYSAGVTGWSINRDGSAEFNDITVRGFIFVPFDGGHFIIDPGFGDAGFHDSNGVFIGGFFPVGAPPLITQVFLICQDIELQADDATTGLRITSPSDASGANALSVTPSAAELLVGVGHAVLHLQRGGAFGDALIVVSNAGLHMPGGIIGRNTSTAATAAIGVVETQDAGLGTISWTVVAGRRYKVFVRVRWQFSLGAAGATANLRIRDGGAGAPTSASALAAGWQATSNGAVNLGDEVDYEWYFAAGDLTAGTHTFGVFYVRVAGGGTVQLTQTVLREFVVYDEG